MLSAKDVADFFLSPVDEEDGEPITNLKLQKLLYYAQGYALAWLDRPLFADQITNWPHGPVVDSVYHAFKVYGSTPLPSSMIRPERYDEAEWHVMQFVREAYGQYSAWRLRDMTHEEHPWLSTRPGEEISQHLLRQYFSDKYPASTFNYDLARMKARVEDAFHKVPDDLADDEAFARWLEKLSP